MIIFIITCNYSYAHLDTDIEVVSDESVDVEFDCRAPICTLTYKWFGSAIDYINTDNAVTSYSTHALRMIRNVDAWVSGEDVGDETQKYTYSIIYTIVKAYTDIIFNDLYDRIDETNAKIEIIKDIQGIDDESFDLMLQDYKAIEKSKRLSRSVVLDDREIMWVE